MKFLKRLFKKAKQESISAAEINSFLEQQKSSLLSQDRLDSYMEEIQQINSALREAIEALNEASLGNESIPSKEKDFMEGNRQEAVRRLEQFITFCEESHNGKDKLKELAESTQRSFSILSHFFNDNIKKIKSILVRYEKVFVQLDSYYSNERLEIVEKGINTYKKIQQLKSRKKELEQEQQILQQKQEKIAEKRKLLEEKQENLENNHSYKLEKQRLRETHEARKKVHEKIKQTFSRLSDAFTKYARMAVQHEEMLKLYATDPVNAFSQDLTLQIWPAMEGMKQTIEELGLKDRKLQKTKEALKVTKEEIINLHQENAHLSREIGEIERSLLTSKILKAIKETREECEKLERDKQRVKEEQENVEKQFSKLNVKEECNNLKQVFTKLGVNLEPEGLEDDAPQ